MKYYGELLKLGVFSREDVVKLVGNSNSVSSLLSSYLKKGYIERVRKNLYTIIDLMTASTPFTRYQLASLLFKDSFIGGHSAFEFYGLENQVFFWVYVYSKTRFKDFEYDGTTFHRLAPKKDMDIITQNKVSLTSLEETLIDCLDDYDIVGGLEELLRCIMLISSLDEAKLISILKRENKGYLWQKSGYILEQFNDYLHLSDNFFKCCFEHVVSAKRPIDSFNPYRLHFEKKWNLFVPASLSLLVNKGVERYELPTF